MSSKCSTYADYEDNGLYYYINIHNPNAEECDDHRCNQTLIDHDGNFLPLPIGIDGLNLHTANCVCVGARKSGSIWILMYDALCAYPYRTVCYVPCCVLYFDLF